MKNDLPYFSHYSTTHNTPRIQALMAEFGMAGYGRYWVLCEKIAASPNATLDISNRAVKLAVAKALELCADEFDNFINFLSDPDIDLVKFDLGKITVDQLVENYNRVSKKRQHDRNIYHSEDFPSSDLQVSSSETTFPNSENIQNKINESKVNKNNDDDPEHPKTSSFFIDKIREEAKKADFILDAALAQKIARSGISPSWISGPNSFSEFVKEKLNDDIKYKDKPHGEKRLLFVNAFTWESYRAEFPSWREEQQRKAAADAERRRIDQVRANKPKACSNCGNVLSVMEGLCGSCPSCGYDYFFNEESGRWEFQEPFNIKADFENLRRQKDKQLKIPHPRYASRYDFIFSKLKREGFSDEEARQKALEKINFEHEALGG